jgi:hypothetical protein
MWTNMRPILSGSNRARPVNKGTAKFVLTDESHLAGFRSALWFVTNGFAQGNSRQTWKGRDRFQRMNIPLARQHDPPQSIEEVRCEMAPLLGTVQIADVPPISIAGLVQE